MTAGRPTKYDEKFCEVVRMVGSQGGWVCEMAEACDVHRSTLDEWASKHPKFSAALARAKQESQAWYERVGRDALYADKFNSHLWTKTVQARFREDYTERREQVLQNPDGSNVTLTVVGVSPAKELITNAVTADPDGEQSEG